MGFSVGEEWLGTKLVRSKSTSQRFPTLVHWTLFDIIETDRRVLGAMVLERARSRSVFSCWASPVKGGF